MYTVQYTEHGVQHTVYAVHCKEHGVQCTVYNEHSTVIPMYSTVYSGQCSAAKRHLPKEVSLELAARLEHGSGGI